MALMWLQSETLTHHMLSPLALKMGSGAAINCVPHHSLMLKPNPQCDGVWWGEPFVGD